jgi:uncharacterized protein DUF5916/cellulose/xylan binding protein with CBM9 domain
MLTAFAAALLLQTSAQTPAPSPAPPPSADSAALRHASGAVPPTLTAVRTMQAPSLDGRLDEAAWQTATPLTALVQSDPEEGQPVSERTEIRVIYDNDAMYVGARLYDREPDKIASQLGRRDAFTQSDDFRVLIDSYHDHRTAFRFDVTPSGVRRDQAFGDDGRFSDNSWDPVWQAATTVDSLGWTAEIRIPFSQLRFSGADEQVWGVRFVRWIQRKNEFSFFPFVGKTESGFTSRFGHLLGIRDVPPPRGLEVLPYSVARSTSPATSVHGSPFSPQSEWFGGTGVDVKYGLTSNLTLNATLNPDFGQVDDDPAFVNLTAFEQFLSERRPFFVEGASIFRFGGGSGFIGFGGTPQVFYSRRIGRPPQGNYSTSPVPGGFDDLPDYTTLAAAAKITGRAGPWTMGVLNAVTPVERAPYTDTLLNRSVVAAEPFTNYFVGRAKRELRGGATGLGFLATAVNRSLEPGARTTMRDAAYVFGSDFFHRWARNTYSVSASVSWAGVRGDTLAIQAAQRSAIRQVQRPDSKALEYRPGLTSLSGVSADAQVSKDGGSINWAAGVSTTTPYYEVNDLGFQTRVDRISGAVFVGRRWTRPGKTWRFASTSFTWGPSFNFDGDMIQNSFSASWFGQHLNWWGVNVFGSYSGRAIDDRLTRGGPLGIKPASWNGGISLFGDNRTRLVWSLFGSYSRNTEGGWSVNFGPALEFRPSSAVSVSFFPFYFGGRNVAQFVTRVADTSANATYDARYMFATIDQRQLDLTTRVNVTMSPDLSIQFYAQPFVFAGDFDNLRELAAPATFNFREYGRDPNTTIRTISTDGAGHAVTYELDPDADGPIAPFRVRNPDFRTRSFQLKGVMRWEYRPGSTLFVVWAHTRGGFVPFDPEFRAGPEMSQLFIDRPTNVLLVKVNYWLSL